VKFVKMNVKFVLFSHNDEESTEIDLQANRMTDSKLVPRSFYVPTSPDNFPLSSDIRYVCEKFEISHLTFV